MTASGKGTTQDFEKAFEWYSKAAELGDVRAHFNIGIMYDDGQGVPQDYNQALVWYKKTTVSSLTGM